MARYITVPAAVPLMDQTGKKRLQEIDPKVPSAQATSVNLVDVPPFTFERFIVEILLSDVRWTQQGYQSLRVARKIEKAVAGKVAGTTVMIEDADWELLKKVCEAPTGGTFSGQTVFVTRQLMGFLDAIMDASEEEPASKNSAPVASAPLVQVDKSA